MDRKPLIWLGSALNDLSSFPDEVKVAMGFALHLAQLGDKHQHAQRMQHNLRDVLEIIESFDADSYRAMYTTRFSKAVYCLHAFKKKSKQGRSTPKRDVELVARRFRKAQEHYAQNFEKE